LRFLADENVEGGIVNWLRGEGYDVRWAAEDTPAANDDDLLRQARDEERILVTNDSDFGELVFRRGLASDGILLLRFRLQSEASRLQTLRQHWQVIESRLPSRFAVLTEGRARFRPIARIE
jgi:predicted nuclease of predicted toxin-antitoxin system